MDTIPRAGATAASVPTEPQTDVAPRETGPAVEAPSRVATGAPPAYAPPPGYIAHPRYPAGPPTYPPRPPRSTSSLVPWLVAAIVVAMILALIVAGTFAALVAGWTIGAMPGATQTHVTTQAFNVVGTPSIVVHDAAGTITLQQGSAGTMNVTATTVVHAANDSAAQNALRNTTVTLSQAGNTVTVNAQFASNWFDGIASQRRVDLVVTVPPGTRVESHLAAGNIVMADTTALAVLDLSAGNVTLTRTTLSGDSRITVSAGNASVDTTLVPGASLAVNVSAGNARLALPADTPAHLTVRTSVGSVTITGWPITPTRNTVTGQQASGDLGTPVQGTVDVTVATGSISVSAH